MIASDWDTEWPSWMNVGTTRSALTDAYPGANCSPERMSIGISSKARSFSFSATRTRNEAIDRQNPYTCMPMREDPVRHKRMTQPILPYTAVANLTDRVEASRLGH